MCCRVFICSSGWPVACGISTVPFIWKCLEWLGWVSVHLCISVWTCGWYGSIYVCPYVCMVDRAEGQMKENQSNWSWRSEMHTQRLLWGDKGRRYRPGPNCQLLVITLILQKQTQRPTDWMTDTHTNRKRQDVYWTQVYSLNHLLNLVAIWRDWSLYILWAIKCSSLQSLVRVTGRPSQNSGKKDRRTALWLKQQSFNQRMWVQVPFIVCEQKPCWGVLHQQRQTQNSRQVVDIGPSKLWNMLNDNLFKCSSATFQMIYFWKTMTNCSAVKRQSQSI